MMCISRRSDSSVSDRGEYYVWDLHAGHGVLVGGSARGGGGRGGGRSRHQRRVARHAGRRRQRPQGHAPQLHYAVPQ